MKPLLIALCLLAAPQAQAGPTSGAAFLKLGAGARPAALGNAYTAAADDVDALYYNPGGLAKLARPELGATHAEWLLDTRFDFVGYAQPTRAGTFGVGVSRLSAGRQESRGADRRAQGGFAASDTAYTLSYSRARGALGLGGNLKLLRSTLGGYSASAAAFDLGAQHRSASRPLSLGLAVLNMGQGMRFLDQTDPLPLTVAAGAAYRFGGALQVTLDLRRELHGGLVELGFGSEYALLPALSLRAGYAAARGATSAGGPSSPLGGLGAGIGLKLRGIRLDYSFAPSGELGNAQRVSLGARF